MEEPFNGSHAEMQPIIPNPHHVFKPIEGFALEPTDITPLLSIVGEFAQQAAHWQISKLKQLENQSNEKFLETQNFVSSLFTASVRIQGTNGVVYTARMDNNFEPFNLRDKIENIDKIEIETYSIFNTEINKQPSNLIYILLDFTTITSPGVFVQPAFPTPNSSQYTISGEDENLVRTTAAKLDEYFKNRKRKFVWIHQGGAYDTLLMFVGVPFIGIALNEAVIIVDKILGLDIGPFHYMAYVFCTLLTLKIFMGLFNYARLIWPLTEIKGANKVTAAHRFIWVTITLGCLGSMVASLFLR